MEPLEHLKKILNENYNNLEGHPNTYTYTKKLTENLLIQERKNNKLKIIRPTTILPALFGKYKKWNRIEHLYSVIYMIRIQMLIY